MRKIHKMDWAHRFESQRWKKINLWLGVTALVLAVIIGTISTIPNINELVVKLVISIGSIIVAILSGLQTFLKPSEVAEKFRIRSDEFEALRHEIEEFLEFHFKENMEGEKMNILAEIREKWSKTGALNVSAKSFDKASKRLRGLNRYPKIDFQPSAEEETIADKNNEKELSPVILPELNE